MIILYTYRIIYILYVSAYVISVYTVALKLQRCLEIMIQSMAELGGIQYSCAVNIVLTS